MTTMIRETIITSIRGIFGQALSTVTAEQTKQAIVDDVLLSDTCGLHISSISSKIPPFIVALGRRQLDAFLLETNTTVTALTLKWLQEDRCDLYFAIVKTPGGISWFDKQVKSILNSVL
jgi:predicted ABC-type sugar transport system permease subunit